MTHPPRGWIAANERLALVGVYFPADIFSTVPAVGVGADLYIKHPWP
jgi:hypothetical protein